MKTRKELYDESNQLLSILEQYPTLLVKQVYGFFPHKQTRAVDGIIYNLKQQKRIAVSDKYISLSPDVPLEPNNDLIRAVWVLLDFFEDVIYHARTEFPSSLFFLTPKDCYEVICVNPGQERQINGIYRLLPIDTQTKRLVVVDSVEYAYALQIPSILAYCTVDMEGRINYYTNEED